MRNMALMWLLVSGVAGAGENPDLDRAVALVDQLNFRGAADALEAAWRRPGNGRAQVLQILELQGVVAATLNQTQKARAYFSTALCLDPDRKLAGNWPPRVTLPFYEAKGRVSEGYQLKLSGRREADGGLAVEVLDPSGQSRSVRFFVRCDGALKRQILPLKGAQAELSSPRCIQEWWAEVLNEHDGVLAQTEPETVTAERVDAPLAVRPDVPTPSTDTRAAQPPIQAARSWPVGRWVGLALTLVAVGGGIAGGLLGLRANSLRSAVDDVPLDAQGRVLGMTRAEALALDQQQRISAVAANICFGAAAAFAVAGVVLFGINSPSESPLSLGVSTSGITAAGVF